MEGLSPTQRDSLEQFNEITANAVDASKGIQLLKACNWNVEQALTLHWTAGDDAIGAAAAASSTSTGTGDLSAPLLPPGNRNGGAADRSGPLSGFLSGTGVFGRVVEGVWRLGATVLHFICSFVFGGAAQFLGDGQASGSLLSRALTTTYGPQLEFPKFYEGSFVQALQTARRDTKLLVVYLHSENGRYTQNFCRQVISNDFVRMMLDENFLLWGGDIARMESHRVGQMIHARQYPCFAVLLPASVDEIRVIGALNGDVQVDATVALLTSCLEEMEMHRAEIIAQREQHTEDRNLRQEQDEEFQQALEQDRKREEEAKMEAERQKEAAALLEAERKKVEDEEAKVLALRQGIEERRKRKASELEPASPDAKAKICIRLPTGQRLERKFALESKLSDVYAWADCLPYLPENIDKGLALPERFMLKTSFPNRDLTEMDCSVQELQLSGAMVLLAPIEDDD